MESLRNAATVAASYVGLGTQNENETETGTSNIAGGEAPQNTHNLSNTQSGVEPVSGELGLGRGGEPYDAGNDQSASALGGSSTYNSSSTNTSQQPTGRQGGLTSGTTSTSNKHSTSNVGSEPLSQKVEAVFGVGGSSTKSNLGGGKSGPGYGQSSKLGSTIAHGTNPERYLYNAKTAPGIGGHRLDDDFTSSNIRHEGADSLPSELGSDAAAGHSKHDSSGLGNTTSGSSNTTSTSGGLTGNRGATNDTSGSTTSSSSGFGSGIASGIASSLGYGRSSNDTSCDTTSTTGTGASTGTTSGVGETVARKVEEYTPGTNTTGSSTTGTSRTGPTTNTTHTGTTGGTGETLARKAEEYTPGTTSTRQTGTESITGNQGYNSGNTRGYEGTAPLDISGSTGERGLAGTALSGAGLGGAAASNSRSTTNEPGYDAAPTSHGGVSGFSNSLDDTCLEAREGYKPHGGHPIGEAAHGTNDGKATFLDYRNDQSLPLGRARPADN